MLQSSYMAVISREDGIITLDSFEIAALDSRF